MKRTSTILVLGLLFLVGLSFAAFTRVRAQKFRAHSIVFHVTDYDKGAVSKTYSLKREVDSVGNWTHAQVKDGVVTPMSHGQIKNGQISSQGEPTQFLGYNVLFQKSENTEFWYSPELNDFLKISVKNKDGSLSTVMEAVDIR